MPLISPYKLSTLWKNPQTANVPSMWKILPTMRTTKPFRKSVQASITHANQIKTLDHCTQLTMHVHRVRPNPHLGDLLQNNVHSLNMIGQNNSLCLHRSSVLLKPVDVCNRSYQRSRLQMSLAVCSQKQNAVFRLTGALFVKTRAMQGSLVNLPFNYWGKKHLTAPLETTLLECCCCYWQVSFVQEQCSIGDTWTSTYCRGSLPTAASPGCRKQYT